MSRGGRPKLLALAEFGIPKRPPAVFVKIHNGEVSMTLGVEMGIRVASALCACLVLASAFADEALGGKTIHVSGTGTDLLNGALVHSKKSTPNGDIQRSTEIVDLDGDLKGKVLYHVTTVIDTRKGTLVNTGDQVFSGTIAGSEPVMLHDSRFRFEVDLKTGSDSGSVFLLDHIAGPRVRCELRVTGTGNNAEGNPTFRYVGTCKFEHP